MALTDLSVQLGIPVWAMVLLIAWALVWKGLTFLLSLADRIVLSRNICGGCASQLAYRRTPARDGTPHPAQFVDR